jgi:hypothetical protein
MKDVLFFVVVDQKVSESRLWVANVKMYDILEPRDWLYFLYVSEGAEMVAARDKVNQLLLRAFGTTAPTRLKLWCFALRCELGSADSRYLRTQLVAAYDDYLVVARRLQSAVRARMLATKSGE